MAESRRWSHRALMDRVLFASSLYMAFWVFIMPGSVFVGSWQSHDAFLQAVWEAQTTWLAPPSMLFKYPAFIELVHALPGGIWCVMVPLQLTPGGRAFMGKQHKTTGRVMLCAASVLMVGFLLIDANKLNAEQVPFGNGGMLAESAESLSKRLLLGVFGALPLHWLPSFNQFVLYCVATWFVFAGVQTFRTAVARRADHPHWAMRHAAAGLWVAAQRVTFSTTRLAEVALGFGTGLSTEATAFYSATYLCSLGYIVLAELAIRENPEYKETKGGRLTRLQGGEAEQPLL